MLVWNDGSSPLYTPHFEGLAAGRSHTQDDARPGRFRQYVPNVTKCFVNPLHWDEGAGKPSGQRPVRTWDNTPRTDPQATNRRTGQELRVTYVATKQNGWPLAACRAPEYP